MNDLPNQPCEHFGGCPVCGSNASYLNVGPEHWMYCEAHKVKWFAGSNLFSGWQQETEEDWQASRKILAGAREVKPRYAALAIDEKRLERERQALPDSAPF